MSFAACPSSVARPGSSGHRFGRHRLALTLAIAVLADPNPIARGDDVSPPPPRRSERVLEESPIYGINAKESMRAVAAMPKEEREKIVGDRVGHGLDLGELLVDHLPHGVGLDGTLFELFDQLVVKLGHRSPGLARVGLESPVDGFETLGLFL